MTELPPIGKKKRANYYEKYAKCKFKNIFRRKIKKSQFYFSNQIGDVVTHETVYELNNNTNIVKFLIYFNSIFHNVINKAVVPAGIY